MTSGCVNEMKKVKYLICFVRRPSSVKGTAQGRMAEEYRLPLEWWLLLS